MTRCDYVQVEGVQILYTDLAGCTPAQGIEALQRSVELVRNRPADSVLSLVDVTDAGYNREAVRFMTEVVRGNRPHIRATAVVGATGIRRIVLNGLRRLSGRSFELFDDLESAKSYLVEQARS